MIKAVTITNPLGEKMEMVLTNPEASGFIIRSIEGLGPVKADVHFTELATLDGSVDNGSRLSTRNIVLSLMFLETPTIEDTRLKSYKFFPIKQNIKFEIETDRRHCFVVGRVESNTPTIFSSSGDEKEGCQISILCASSYFQDMEDSVIDFAFVSKEFEFPFSNESLSEPKIEFGSINVITEGNVFYNGDSETGMVIHIHAIGPVTGFGIYRADTGEKIKLSDSKIQAIVGSGISNKDDIIISTEKGKKSVRLLRNGVYYNILNALEAPITWFQLRKGDNIFTFDAASGLSYLKYDITYKILYDGV